MSTTRSDLSNRQIQQQDLGLSRFTVRVSLLNSSVVIIKVEINVKCGSRLQWGPLKFSVILVNIERERMGAVWSKMRMVGERSNTSVQVVPRRPISAQLVVGVVLVQQFDVREGKVATLAFALPFPLAIHVYFGHLHHVAHLQKRKRGDEWERFEMCKCWY